MVQIFGVLREVFILNNMINRERIKKMFTHYRRRLKLYELTEKDNQHIFRSTGKPCSCFACGNEKFIRNEKHKNMKKNLDALQHNSNVVPKKNESKKNY